MIMRSRRFLTLVAAGGLAAASALSETAPERTGQLLLELNTVQEVAGACRLTFVAQNQTGADVDQAVFETVVFDASGGVISLSLFDFRDLPAGRPRVRQFDLPGIACDTLGRALINGANTCTVDGADSDLCASALVLSSRLSVELLG